ncbi:MULTISPECIES: phytoene desaturase family protein [unclassified Rhodococcus (in: high G+C Gram-positive bacteria)]|uniref:phytoene desaturase family protein n=1 Tax=unclassified Rhodococcus (in: high G+C Gram-positive bacteria) TaxID=192944 RepID=UPI000A76CBC1|nr:MULTISPECIES: NAD(P)/FAD-dependent oxidoreductase [unclassified Rhodococcus (in: high G+C Gram-positive bacteria)]
MSTYDVVVIGGGLAGMTSAAALAAAGKKVVVLEQYSVVGGSTHVFRRKGQWEWQVGLHHLGDCGPDGDMPTMFRGLGLGEHITFEPMSRDGYERFVFPDLEFEVPTDWDEYRIRLTTLFPAERRAIERFVKVTRKFGGAVDRVASAESVTGMAKTAWKLGRHAPLARSSLTAVMDHFGLSPRLQILLSMSPSGSMNCPPHRLPFLAYASFLAEFVGGGAWFPHGGGQTFASNLLRVIEHFGGEVVTRAFAEEIIIEHGRAAGVRLAGGATYRADTVISTADIKKTYNVLLPAGAVDASTMKRVDGFRMSAPFFNAFLGADVDLAATRPNQDSFSVPSWTSLSDIERGQRFRPGDTAQSWLDRICPVLPAYIHCSDIKDPTAKRYAPDGCSSLESMFPIVMDHRLWGADDVDRRDHGYAGSATYDTMKTTLTDLMVARTQSALPELDGHIIHREAATPLTQERYTQSTEGASYGIEFNMKQTGVSRPGPRTHVDGLFLAGASCRTGPATEGVLLSGIVTAGAILGRNLVAEFRDGRPLVPAGTIAAVPSGWDSLAAARATRQSRPRLDVATPSA